MIAGILKNPELARGLKYFSPVPVLLLPTLGIEGIFSTYRKTIYIAVYEAVTRTLMLIFIVVPVIIFDQSYIIAIYGWIAVSVVILVIAFYFKGIPFKGITVVKSGLTFREILNYSLPLVSASIAGIIYRSANQFYISRYFGPETFAEFSNGFIEMPFVQMITGATAGVLMPVFSRIIHEKSDFSQITTLWRNALKKSAVLIYPLVIFFLFYSGKIITIVYSQNYAVSAKYFSVALTLNFFSIIVFAPLLLSMGETRYYARIHYILAAATWIIQYLVILIFQSPLSVAVAFVLIGICGINISLIYVSKKINVTFLELFPVKQFLIIAVHSCISLLPVYMILKYVFPETGDLLTVMIAFAAYAGILLLSSGWVNINYLEILMPLIKKNK
jgi:O-antigen/teichoic acid export membrane protein